MGNARSRLGQFDLAVLHYVRANELGMHSARLYNNLAVALMETGSERDARRAFLRALQVEPGYPPVAASLAHYGKDAGWLEDPPD
jgi:Flp pilus assembly protein TadD